jgi:hypothetical protein
LGKSLPKFPIGQGLATSTKAKKRKKNVKKPSLFAKNLTHHHDQH